MADRSSGQSGAPQTGTAAGAASNETAKPATESVSFDRDVAAVFARRCLQCHNGGDKKGGLDLSKRSEAEKGGDSGSVIQAGKLDESLLWTRISDNEMPPKQPLSADERAIVRNWIAGGAAWGANETIDPYAFSSESRAGYDWWSLQPVRELSPPDWPAETPAVARQINSPIDRFIASRLSQAGLALSPIADKRTLLRRVYFDLLGRPPSSAEANAFLLDSHADAFERLVDRLLESPEYGERWGRRWLDLVRFGESHGFEYDRFRPNAWRYRDWVIQSLNADLPYNQFVAQQVAGDVLLPNDPRGVIATGFLVAAPWDETGQNQISAAMRAVVRQDEVEDLVAVTAQTFLGLTVNCARCHDHKFDPVTQAEYYQLASCFEGVKQGDRETLTPGGGKTAEQRRNALAPRREQLGFQLAELERPIRERLEKRQLNSVTVSLPKPIAAWEFDGDLRDSVGNMHGTAVGSAKLNSGRLVLDGSTAAVMTTPVAQTVHAKSLLVTLELNTLDQQGGGAITLQSLDGVEFDSIVFAELEPRRWMAGSNGFVRTQSFRGPEETTANQAFVTLLQVYHEDGRIVLYRNGVLYGSEYRAGGTARFLAEQSRVLFGLRHTPVAAGRLLAAEIERAALYNVPLSPEQAAVLADQPIPVSESQLVAEMSPADLETRRQLLQERTRLDSLIQMDQGGPAYAAARRDVQPTAILIRGNPATRGAEVFPAGLRALKGTDADWKLNSTASDADRRIALAKWLSSTQNPLTARVAVNRLWQGHFGTGIVETPNDFGFAGGRPSHPELLDWLAHELVHGGWSLKAMHRLIMRSYTYRQSSQPVEAAKNKDAGNRLLHRFPPQRLDAESLRDTLLVLSDTMHPVVGGPGYRDFKTFSFNSQFYVPVDSTEPDAHRRSVYRTWVRSGRNEFLDAFDCPDPSTISPRRAVTTTPLQALSLLNNSFALRMCDRWAARLQREAGTEVDQQVRLAIQQAFQRTASDGEVAEAASLIREHGLAAYCRVLVNSNELLYVD